MIIPGDNSINKNNNNWVDEPPIMAIGLPVSVHLSERPYI